jgi:hypothetical protein
VETAKVGRPAWERRDGFVREHHRDDSDLVQQDEIPARVGLEQHRMDLQNLPDIFERMMARQLVYIHRARRRDVALSCCPARECHRQLQGVREWQSLVWAQRRASQRERAAPIRLAQPPVSRRVAELSRMLQQVQ